MNVPLFHPTSRRVAPAPLALACVLALGLPAAHAAAEAEAEPAAEADAASTRVRNLDTVKVIGNHEDPQGTTGSAYVLTQTELDKFRLTNANDVLRSVPGVYVREENGIGFFPRVGVRASSAGRSNRISVLEDGIPAMPTTTPIIFPTWAASAALKCSKARKSCCTARRPRPA